MNKNKTVPELRFPEFRDEGEWEEKKLGEIGEPLMCKRIFKDETTDEKDGNIPFYKIGTFGGIADSYITKQLFEEYKEKYSYPQKGEILISAAGTIGRLVVFDGEPSFFQDSNIVWLRNDEGQIINRFLYYSYLTLTWQTSDGGVIRRLYNSDLKNMDIILPKNKAEQKKIADCLSSLDEVIEVHEEKLLALQDHKRGLMQNLFPQEGETKPKYRFPEFENNGEWEVVNFNKYITLYRGSSPRPIVEYLTREEDGVNWIKIGDTKTANGFILSNIEEKITVEGSKRSRYVEIGELILANSMSYGKVYELAVSGCIYDGWFVLRNFEKNFDKQYLLQLLNSNYLQEQYSKLAAGGIVKNISSEIVNATLVLCPNIEEQQKIADCLSSVDDLIAEQTERIEQLKLHKRGLMQGLFPKIEE